MGQIIDKRIRNLNTSIQSRELCSDFTSGLQDCVAEADIRDEFPGASDLLRNYRDESFPKAWHDFVQDITDMMLLCALVSRKHTLIIVVS